MKKTLLAVMLAAAFAPSVAMAEAGDIVVRLRAVHVNASEDSSLGKYVGQNIAAGLMPTGAELEVESNTLPEIDFSYYITKNIAAELILATGTRHDVNIIKSAAGPTLTNQDLGSVNLLPPTLTLQWHFMPDQMFDPYVGAGVNYTIFMDRHLELSQGVPGSKIKVDRSSLGLALQAGFDVNLKDGWLVNFDVKKLWVDTEVKLRNPLVGGTPYTKIDDLDIDPWVIGVGIGKKF